MQVQWLYEWLVSCCVRFWVVTCCFDVQDHCIGTDIRAETILKYGENCEYDQMDPTNYKIIKT